MDKNPELRVGIPLRKGMPTERFDGRLIARGRLSRGGRKDNERSNYQQNAGEFPVEARAKHWQSPDERITRTDQNPSFTYEIF
jgi:hypothetical protein